MSNSVSVHEASLHEQKIRGELRKQNIPASTLATVREKTLLFLHLNFVLLHLAPCLLFPHGNLIALINNYICVFLACSCDVSYKWFLQEARSDCQHSAETMSFTSRTTRRLRHPGKGLLNWEITYFWDCNLTPLWYLWFDFHFNMFIRENLC